MASPDETAAKLTLKMAGVFQEVKDIWVARLDAYFSQLDDLVDGQWFDSEDLSGIIKESRMASKEALTGLATDLSAELVHESSGAFGRFESERASLLEEINDLRSALSDYMSRDETSILRENMQLREAIFSMPQFRILEIIKSEGTTTYKQVSKESGISIGKTRKFVKSLKKKGYVNIDKNTRPHSISFLTAPWRQIPGDSSFTGANNTHTEYQQNYLESLESSK